MKRDDEECEDASKHGAKSRLNYPSVQLLAEALLRIDVTWLCAQIAVASNQQIHRSKQFQVCTHPVSFPSLI